MKEELMAQLTPILELAKDGLFKAVEVAQEQFPDLIEQLLTWNYWIHLGWFSFGVFIFLLSFVFIVKAKPDNPDTINDSIRT